MIFEIFILVIVIILASVRASVCSQHRNIADRALKTKLVDNIVNILRNILYHEYFDVLVFGEKKDFEKRKKSVQ